MKPVFTVSVGITSICVALVLASCGTPLASDPNTGGTGQTTAGGTSQSPSGEQATTTGANGTDSTTTGGATSTGSQTGTSTTTTDTTTGTTSGGGTTSDAKQGTLTLRMAADYSTPGSSSTGQSGQGIPLNFVRPTSCQELLPFDGPPYAAGLDCDGDGGVGRYITPSVFKIALKRATLSTADGTTLDLVPDTGTLAKSQVIDLSSPVTLAAAEVPVTTYTGMEVQVYYYELVMPLNDPPVNQHIRVYLSDDDFEAEGNLGHHQGDITMIDDAGHELGFVMGGSAWTAASVAPLRGEYSNGAGGVDPETGHVRGLFGDTTLWNATPFMQGATQDICIFEASLNLKLTSTGTTLTMLFNLADSWFYEDYNNNQTFDPCGTPGPNGMMDGCSEGAGWAPLLPYPEAVVE
jgi:hypothetical protein